jgi:hypothetical protein
LDVGRDDLIEADDRRRQPYGSDATGEQQGGSGPAEKSRLAM